MLPDPSEIILIFRYSAQETCIIIINVEKKSMSITQFWVEVALTENVPSLTELFLAVTDKFEGRPSFCQIALRVQPCPA